MAGHIIFEIKKANKHFPGVHALKDIDFDLCAGEIHGLVGHNGAGKSTLVKVLTGSYLPESGEIFLRGEPVTFKDERDSIAKGIGIVSQEGSLIPGYTGIENIFLGTETVKGIFLQNKVMKAQGCELLNEFGIEMDLSAQAEDLSPAAKKLIEIFKVVSRKPDILIYDEPTAALSEKERQLLFKLMKQQRDMGYGIIFISHYIDEVIEMSDRITVMRNGSMVSTVDGSSATKDQIVHMMINREQKTEYVEKNAEIGEIVLEAKDVSEGNIVKGASLYIRSGEIVGLFGTVGSGRTELCETIFGANKLKSGEIFVSGQKVKIKSVRSAIKAGISMIPEDRLIKALLLEDSVNDNLSLPFIKDYAKAAIVNRKKEHQSSQRIIDSLNILTSSLEAKVNSLSGGNKQKVSFGRWVITQSEKTKLFIFDEPTEGVDVGARAEMYKIIVNLAENGAACLVVSSDIAEIMGLSDRIYIMSEGKIVDEISRNTPNLQYEILKASVGLVAAGADNGMTS